MTATVVKETVRATRPVLTDCGGGESVMFGDEVDDSIFQSADSVLQGIEDMACGGSTPVTIQGQLEQIDQQIDAHELQFGRLDDATNLEIEGTCS